MNYVLYLYDNPKADSRNNQYGYYTGKHYTVNREPYPICTETTDKAKKYNSEKKAINAGNSLIDKCAYVLSFRVQQIK